MRLPALRAAAAALAAAALCACFAGRSEPLRGPVDLSDPKAARGREVFMARCDRCHPLGEAGLAPALNNKPLPGFLVAFQARHGLGAMPAFDEKEIPDADLEAVIAYMKALRRNE